MIERVEKSKENSEIKAPQGRIKGGHTAEALKGQTPPVKVPNKNLFSSKTKEGIRADTKVPDPNAAARTSKIFRAIGRG